jgi:hypothetical protein
MKRSALPPVRGVWPNAQMAQPPHLTQRGEGLTEIPEGVVRHDAAHADAVAAVPGQRPPENAATVPPRSSSRKLLSDEQDGLTGCHSRSDEIRYRLRLPRSWWSLNYKILSARASTSALCRELSAS